MITAEYLYGREETMNCGRDWGYRLHSAQVTKRKKNSRDKERKKEREKRKSNQIGKTC